MNIVISNPEKLTNRNQFTRVQAHHSTRPAATSAHFSGALNNHGVEAAFTCTAEFMNECAVHGIRNVKFDRIVIESGITFLHFQAFIEFNIENMDGTLTSRIGASEGRFIVPLSRDMKVEIR